MKAAHTVAPMVVYTCANCQRELEIDDELAGQRVRCPHCGNVEVAPATRTPSARPARPASERAAKSPVSDDPSAAALERELARVHPVMFRARPVQASLLALGAGGGAALAISAWTLTTFNGYRWAAYAGIVVLVAALGWLGWWKLLTRATTVVITNRRTTVSRGLFSRSSSEMRHDQVQDIQINQTFAQRMMRVGSFGLDGSGTDEVEIVVQDLPDPMRLRRLVDSQRAGELHE